MDEAGNIIKIGNANSIKTESVSNNKTLGENALPNSNNISHSDTTVKNNDMQNSGNNTAEVSKNHLKLFRKKRILLKQKKRISAKE